MTRHFRAPRWGMRTIAVLSTAVALVLAEGVVSPSVSVASDTSGITSTSIVIGSHQPLTGIAAPGYSEIAPAENAFYQYVNAHGGVNGRKIQFKYLDDMYNPANTPTVVRQLVLNDDVFGIVSGLGTPTHQTVLQYLNTNKVPDLFVASGCVCWSNAKKYPYTFGYQTDYTIEAKILGKYVTDHYKGQKVAYIYQNDDVGQGALAGLRQEIPSSAVVAKQPYSVNDLLSPSGLSNQVSAAKAAGAQVVVLYTVNFGTASVLKAAAQIGYHPQFVVSSIGSDPPIIGGLLGSANASLENGVVTDTYLPSEFDMSNPWIKLFKTIHDKYDANEPFDGNTVYGMSAGYLFMQALKGAGKNPTRQSIVNTLNTKGSSYKGPGLVPLGYSKTNHGGYLGAQIGTVDNGTLTLSGPVYVTHDTGPITTYTGQQPAPPKL
ncbi:MAG TPA: ABC transporter substrate-binding protein [Acidimicrobiia bacterium]|nr:ABC transporter substrate-binding protein [Acidimicrobiia bacterium]